MGNSTPRALTLFERMLARAPVYTVQRGDGYHCTWTVDGIAVQTAIGLSDTAGGAIYQAWKNAVDNGWVMP